MENNLDISYSMRQGNTCVYTYINYEEEGKRYSLTRIKIKGDKRTDYKPLYYKSMWCAVKKSRSFVHDVFY